MVELYEIIWVFYPLFIFDERKGSKTVIAARFWKEIIVLFVSWRTISKKPSCKIDGSRQNNNFVAIYLFYLLSKNSCNDISG